MDTLIPLSEVVKQYHIDERELYRLIQAGKIREMNLAGTILFSEEQIKMNLPKEQREDYKQFSHLNGVGIHMMAAVRRYGVTLASIQKWVKEGYIARLGQEGQKVILNEADIAYCAFIYKKYGGGQGKWLFNPDGTPYIPKSQR